MTTTGDVSAGPINPWRRCRLCLRQNHCTKEGGSYVCRYGTNNICPSLPLEGVNEMDYENHITRDHAGKQIQCKILNIKSTNLLLLPVRNVTL